MMIACHHYFWGNVFGFSTRNEREREKLLTLYFLQKIRWFLLQNRPKFSCNLPLRRAAVLSRIKNASDFFAKSHSIVENAKRTRKTHLCDCDFRFSLYRFRALKWTMARSWKKKMISKVWKSQNCEHKIEDLNETDSNQICLFLFTKIMFWVDRRRHLISFFVRKALLETLN